MCFRSSFMIRWNRRFRKPAAWCFQMVLISSNSTLQEKALRDAYARDFQQRIEQHEIDIQKALDTVVADSHRSAGFRAGKGYAGESEVNFDLRSSELKPLPALSSWVLNRKSKIENRK